jgi:hypothetical protein
MPTSFFNSKLLRTSGEKKLLYWGTIPLGYLPPLLNATLCKQEFFDFKIQGSTEWMDLTFADAWTSISWSPSLKVKYSNLMILAEIAKCQCVSTATCEKGRYLFKILLNKNMVIECLHLT